MCICLALGLPAPAQAASPETQITEAFATGSLAAAVKGQINRAGQTTITYDLVYGPATSAWCTSSGASGAPAWATPSAPLTSAYTLVLLEIDLQGLSPGTQYCASLIISYGASTTASAQASFTTASTSTLSANSQAMLTRINELRTQAGLAPFVDDPAIAQAAGDHSNYWNLNAPPGPENILSYHEETPGAPGFTGHWPAERCEAVGARCASEDMSMGDGPVDAVNSWIATPFHGRQLTDPNDTIAGGDQVGNGPDVIDFGRLPQASEGWPPLLLQAPLGYPNNVYDGNRGLVYGEAPDPLVECNALNEGTALTYPLGAALTLRIPPDEAHFGATLSAMTLTRLPDGQSLSLCNLWSMSNKTRNAPHGEPAVFQAVPDQPLAANTRYQATATYTYPSSGAPLSFSWQFQTTARDQTCYASEPCARQISEEPSQSGTRRPSLARLRFAPPAFKPATRGATISRMRTGSIVTYTDSTSATTEFAVLRETQGRRRGRSCVSPPGQVRHARLCVRLVQVDRFTHHDTAGSNTFRFSGRVRGHALALGRYDLRAVARLSQATSQPVTASFRVVH
jgi:hypothetical protein